MIPGKTFEYLRMGIPILSISPKGSAVADILEETQRGYNVENNDIETMEKLFTTIIAVGLIMSGLITIKKLSVSMKEESLQRI